MILYTSDELMLGEDVVDKVFLGDGLVYPNLWDVHADITITSTSTLDIHAVVHKIDSGTIDIFSSSSLTANAGVDRNASINIESTSTFEAFAEASIVFEMYVTSATEPVFGTVFGGTFNVQEESSGYWRVVSANQITSFSFLWPNSNNRDNITEIDIVQGSTLTNLNSSFLSLVSLTTFTWAGDFNCTSIQNAFSGCESLTSFPLIDTSGLLDVSSAWQNCESLTSFPLLNTSSCTTFYNAWYGCIGLTSFPQIDTSNALSLKNTWYECSSLVSMPALNTSLCENFDITFGYCTDLEHVGAMDTSKGTTFNVMFINCTSLVCVTSIDTSNPSAGNHDRVFEGCTALANPTVSQVALIHATAGYAYVNSNPCPMTVLSSFLIYELTEELITLNTVNNSGTSDTTNDGLCQHVGTSDDPEGSTWYPTSAQYPENGIIRLYTAGSGYKRLDTQWIPPTDSEWTVTGVYQIVAGNAFKMYAIHYKGNGYCDIYLADQDTAFPRTPNFENSPLVLSGDTWKIIDDAPSIIYSYEIEYTMGNYTIT